MRRKVVHRRGDLDVKPKKALKLIRQLLDEHDDHDLSALPKLVEDITLVIEKYRTEKVDEKKQKGK